MPQELVMAEATIAMPESEIDESDLRQSKVARVAVIGNDRFVFAAVAAVVFVVLAVLVLLVPVCFC